MLLLRNKKNYHRIIPKPPLTCQSGALSSVNSCRSETKIAEFENSLDLDEVAHDEPPHLDLHCLPFSL